ncbi:unnamed protein product, partial [Ixodes persulcatus]
CVSRIGWRSSQVGEAASEKGSATPWREGAKVVVADINLDAARATTAELKGKGHLALHVDVGDSTSVASLIKNASTQSTTPLSIVVNSAGVAKRSSVVDTSEDDFDEELRVNLKVGLIA